MVGKRSFFAKIDFRASITRDNSPPDAIFSIGRGAAPLFAEKRYATSSPPDTLSVVGVRLTSKRASAIPTQRKISTTAEAKLSLTSALLLCSRSAAAAVCFSASATSSRRAFRCSSLCSISASCATYLSRNSISASTLSTRCLRQSV